MATATAQQRRRLNETQDSAGGLPRGGQPKETQPYSHGREVHLTADDKRWHYSCPAIDGPVRSPITMSKGLQALHRRYVLVMRERLHFETQQYSHGRGVHLTADDQRWHYSCPAIDGSITNNNVKRTASAALALRPCHARATTFREAEGHTWTSAH